MNERWEDGDYRLCYVDRQWAYFTTQPLEEQWGDDWDDAPYEHNAGEPYLPSESFSRYNRETKQFEPGTDYVDGLPPWDIRKAAYEAALETPAELANGNSAYSVEMINAGAVAWLAPDRWSAKAGAKPIMAGTTLPEFRRLVREGGGKVYEEQP